VWSRVLWCGVVWCGAVCDAECGMWSVEFGVWIVRCEVLRGGAWCELAWCAVVWCDVVWCGVVLGGVRDDVVRYGLPIIKCGMVL
jgi:hypothetical protein